MQATRAPADPFADLRDDNAAFLDNPAPTPAPTEGPVVYRSPCKKCHGTGSFGRVSALGHSKCTLCGGKGYHEYKHDEAHRNARKERRAARKAKQAEAKVQTQKQSAQAYLEANPVVKQWFVDQGARNNDFAASLLEKLVKWGNLTEGQLRAIHNDLARQATRTEEQAARGQRAQVLDVSAIEKAFNKARATGLRTPKLRTEKFTFSLASAVGRNAGSIYVKGTQDDIYLGKVTQGVFHPSRDCTPAVQQALIDASSDLLGAAVTYGRLTGRCSVCNRKLTDPASVANGIGPICEGNFF